MNLENNKVKIIVKPSDQSCAIRFHTWAILILPVMLVGWPRWALGQTRSPSQTAQFAREQLLCGPNCAYVFMRLHGVAVQNDFVSSFEITDVRGASLLELRNVCRAHGLACEIVYESDRSFLQRSECPIILYDTPGWAPGHYTVLLHTENGTARIFDGSSGKVKTVMLSSLSDIWSGYAIVLQPAQRLSIRIKNICCIVIIACSFIIVGFGFHIFLSSSSACTEELNFVDRNRKILKVICTDCTTKLRSLLTMILLMIGSVLSQSLSAQVAPPSLEPTASSLNSPDGQDFWRVPKNDGLNCLYLELRAFGYNGDYSHFRALASGMQFPLTMNDLRLIAQRASVDLVPVRITCQSLRTMNVPVIVHEEENGLEEGGFSLLLWYNPNDTVTIVSGSSVTRRTIGRSNFERNFSGFALVPSHAREFKTLIQRIGCGSAMLMAGITFLLTRPRAASAAKS